jgi:hypothetical protein
VRFQVVLGVSKQITKSNIRTGAHTTLIGASLFNYMKTQSEKKERWGSKGDCFILNELEKTLFHSALFFKKTEEFESFIFFPGHYLGDRLCSARHTKGDGKGRT